MPNRKKTTEAEDTKQERASPGDNSVSVTPKDVSSKSASAKDVKERKIASDNPEEKEEEMLDDAVEMTFPASDPIAIPTPDKVERDERRGKGA